MLLYGTLKHYATEVADPWIEWVILFITDKVKSENRILAEKVTALENSLEIVQRQGEQTTGDVQCIDRQLQHCATDSQLAVRAEELENAITNVSAKLEDMNGAMDSFLSSMSASDQKHKSNKSAIETCANDVQQIKSTISTSLNEFQQIKSYILALEQTVNQTVSNLATVMKRQDAMETKATAQNEPLLGFSDRLAQLEVRLATLQGNMETERLERENMKLKRRSFLSR